MYFNQAPSLGLLVTEAALISSGASNCDGALFCKWLNKVNPQERVSHDDR